MDGAAVEELPAQPLRFAVLAYIAVKGEVARDELLALFWPRRRAARARHSLNQALYQIRADLGAGAVVTRGEIVRAGEAVSADCVAFERAATGSGPEAADWYHGPFLDGFPAPTAPFASWMQERRAHYGALHAMVRRTALDDRVASADRSGAVEVAAAWARLEGEPGEGRRRLEDLLQSAPSMRTRPQAGAARPVPRPGRRRAPAALVAGLVLALTAFGVTLRSLPGRPPSASQVSVAVAPFQGERPPSDPEAPHRAIGEAATWIDGWSAVELEPTTAPEAGWGTDRADRALAAARAGGHRYLVTGHVGIPAGPRPLTVEVWHVPSGRRIVLESVLPGESPGDALARIGFSLVRAISDLEGGGPLPHHLLEGASSPAAAGHFLRGRALLARGQSGAAADAFESATRVDPAFARAWVRGALAALLDRDPERAGDIAGRALLSLGHDPPPGPVGLLPGIRQLAEGRVVAVERLEAEADARPTDFDAAAAAGIALDVLGAFTGAGPEAALTRYDVALELEPGSAAIRGRALDMALAAGRIERARTLLLSMDEETIDSDVRRLIPNLLAGDAIRRAAAIDSLRWEEGDALEAAFTLLARVDLVAADTTAALLQQSIRTPGERARGASLRLVALVGLRRPGDAREAWLRTGLPEDEVLLAARLAGLSTGTASDSLPLPSLTIRGSAHAASLHGDSSEILRFLGTDPYGPEAEDAADPERAGLRHALHARLHLLAGDTTAAIRRLENALSRFSWLRPDLPALACLGPQRLLAVRILAAAGEAVAAARHAEALRLAPCPSDLLFVAAADSALAATVRSPGG